MKRIFGFLRIGFIVLFSAGFIYSVIAYISYHGEARSAEARIDELRGFLIIEEEEITETNFDEYPESVPSDAAPLIHEEIYDPYAEIRPRFRYIHGKNNDIVGWLRIDGTKIDYPVMLNPDDHLYYDRVNFDRVKDEIGVPYLDGRCTIAPKNQIQIIFGHNIRRRGLIFHDLTLYEDREFWEQYQFINYDTLYEDAVYQIFAVIDYDARNVRKSDFQFHRYTHFSTAKTFDNTVHNFEVYREEVKSRSLYETGIDFDITDELLILATCANNTSNSRVVLFAKKVD